MGGDAHRKRPSRITCGQLVEQVLFTSPGERVNMPDFGSGLLQLAFAPNSMEMARGHPVHRAGSSTEMARQLCEGAVGGGVGPGSGIDGHRNLLPAQYRRDSGTNLTFRGYCIMIYRCCNVNRKSAILDNPAVTLNGIDYLEVAPNTPPQQTLLVYCLQAAPST